MNMVAKPSRVGAFLVFVALVVSGCTPSDTAADESGSASETTVGESGTASDQETGSTDPDQTSDGSSSAADPIDTEVPPIPILTPSEPIVSPGDTFTVTADPRHNGPVVMRAGDTVIASANLSNGSAMIAVPGEATVGTYTLEATDDVEGGALGVVGVADTPSLWVSTPRWISTGTRQKATVTTFDIPDGLTVALELTRPGQAAERLVPNAFAGLAPIPFGGDPGEGIPRGATSVTLPEGFTGTVRAIADTAENLTMYADTEQPPAVISASVHVQTCDDPSGVTGNLVDSGSVSAVWIESGIQTSRLATDDGAFTIPAGPGTVMVSAARGADATAASPQFVQVKCGELLDVGSMDETVDTGPAPRTYLGGLTLDDAFAFTATASGDIEFSHEGITDCSATGSEVELQFTDSGSDPHFYYVTIPDFSGTGRYEAEFQIINVLKDGESSGSAIVEIEQGRIEDFDAVGGMFSATYDGALGSGTVEGTYTCLFFTALEASHVTIRGAAPRGGVFAAPYLLTAGSSADDACRKALVWGNGDSEYLDVIVRKAAREIFTERLPRVEAITQEELGALLTLAAQQQLLGTPEEEQVDTASVAGAVGADYLITLRVTDVGGSAILSVVATDMRTMSVPYRNTFEAESDVALFDVSIGADVASALQKIGICGEVDEETVKVASGEEREITYTLTDLAGEAAEGAIDAVSSTCGTFEPTSGNANGGDFTTTFTGGDGGCTDQVTFVAKTDTAVGEVTTEQDEDESTTAIAIPMFAYRYTIDMESTWTAGDYSSDSAVIHAESEGEFFVEPDFQQIIGAGTGKVSGGDPAVPCVLISASGTTNRPQQWTVDGTYSVWMNGDLASGSPEDGGTLRLDPAGSNIKVTGSYSDPECFPPGSQSNEVFSYLIVGVLVTNPALIVGEFPQGFEMPFTADGQRTEKSWPITVGRGSGTVTIEVWQLESDG